MPATLTSFKTGELVISIYGNGDGSGSGVANGAYTLDQASPITFYELTTSGTVDGQLVLPETTAVVGGTTEYAISGEYGSASEGNLELSSDGQSLTIFGYGVNNVAFNAAAATGGSNVYGNPSLGQSTSIQGGIYTSVARVVADVGYNTSIDTSTSLYGLYNTNNPRSVATVNGTQFWVSGQSTKGSTTQGVFTAADGSQSSTAIDTSTDTREAEIVNGVLYVSRDSSQGATNIASYGGLPTSATVAVPLSGINGTVTLAAGQGNTVNASAVGTSVNLSPQGFFFANATTLYVADSGFPKLGGLGDGGLQKWVSSGGTWKLAYTLSTGLNMVPDTATSGVTGLYGLTGVVNGGTVSLYATTSTAGELDQSLLVSVTDTLAATSLPTSESFTTLMAATSGTIIRGVSFAPTASTAAPTNVTVMSGATSSGLSVGSGSTLTVASGGVATAATVLSGGAATISGTETGGFVAHGASQTVLGSVTGDQVDGVQLVSAATAVVSNEAVNNGGSVNLFLKGTIANNLIVSTGGSLNISGNATANGTVVNGGAVVLQSPKAVLSGGFTFAGPGLLQATAVTSSGFGDLAVISGFGTGDLVDVTVISSGATLTTALVGGNTVATISGTSGTTALTQSFIFSGAVASNLTLQADTTTGVQIAFVPPPTTNVTVSSGATSTGLTVTSGSTLTVNGGGSVISATVLSGGIEVMGGVETGTVISALGNEAVSGTATGDRVYGTQLVSASTAVINNETVFNGGAINVFLKGAAANGIVVSSGGSLNLSGNVSATNTTLAGGATVSLQSPKTVLAGGVIEQGTGNTILVTGLTSAGFGNSGVISGFVAGDTVDVTGFGVGATLTSALVSGNTVLTVSSGTTATQNTQSYVFAGGYASGFFTLTPDTGTGVQINAVGTACYCPGTLIATPAGEAAVEKLAIGDLVVTASGAARSIKWIGRRSYAGRFARGQTQILPIRISAGALADGVPRRDLVVSPLHAMFINGVLIPAGALINGVSVVQLPAGERIDYVHVELDTHDVILAEGAPSETFVDDESRGMFHNAAEYASMYPDAVRVAARYCAPRVEEGAILESVRARLAARVRQADQGIGRRWA